MLLADLAVAQIRKRGRSEGRSTKLLFYSKSLTVPGQSGTRYFTTQCDEALAEQRATLFCETHSELTVNVNCPR